MSEDRGINMRGEEEVGKVTGEGSARWKGGKTEMARMVGKTMKD